MHKAWLLMCALSVTALGSGCSKGADAPSQQLSPAAAAKVEEVGPPDSNFKIKPDALIAPNATDGSDTLQDIVKVGARALAWVDLLQKDVAPENREQIWRRVDRIGHEPSPLNPIVYNPEIILGLFHDTMKAMPKPILDVITATGALPNVAPAGMSIKDVVAPIRDLNTIYSRASRWLALYQYHDELTRLGMDMRGWLKIRQERDALMAETARWDQLSNDERAGFIAEVSESCTLTTEQEPADCVKANSSLNQAGRGKDAADWLTSMISMGQPKYDERFVVQKLHPNASTATTGSYHALGIPETGIDADTLSWIQDRVNEAWTFKDAASVLTFGVKLFLADAGLDGVLKVIWQNGALPHVNGIAGDEITMDANEPRWLEQVQVTMRHEFGHVLGFPDCYVEFWDGDKKAFIDYALDPLNAMCALSGGFHDVHRDALLKAYFPQK